MTQITINITPHQANCLSLEINDIQDLLESQIEGRTKRAEVKIIEMETQSATDNGRILPPTIEGIVQSAFDNGTVKSAAQAQSELDAKIAAAALVVTAQSVDAELLRRQIEVIKTVNPDTPVIDATGVQQLRSKTSEDMLGIHVLGDAASDGQKTLLQTMLGLKNVFDSFDAAASTLKALGTIPDNYADDTHWVA